ncbi:MAG: TIGR02921 family PEP-CTERM protein [Chloroflexota bacterium]
MKTFWKHLITQRKIGYFLFWSWNIIFLCFMSFGFIPLVLPELISAVRVSTIPPQFLLYGTILALVPLVTMILAWFLFRKQPSKLLKLGYGVEGPIMLLLAFRFFIIRQMTPQVNLILIIATVGILTYLWQLIDNEIEKRPFPLQHVRMIGLTMLLTIGIYVSLILTFYIIPMTYVAGEGIVIGIGEFFEGLRVFSWAELIEGIRDRFRYVEWMYIPLIIFWSLLMVYTATLFIVMPIAISFLYVRAWWQGVQHLLKSYSKQQAVAAITAVFIIILLAFVVTDAQPQHNAFAFLEDGPTTIQEQNAIINNEEAIQRGLLNAYLSQYRYISSQGDVFHIRDMYRDVFSLKDEQAGRIQATYEQVARPLLYRPINQPESHTDRFRTFNAVFQEESNSAAKLYEDYFDELITEGEEETVVRAVRTTWDFQQAQAGWQAVADREILLTHQEINVTEHGDWAEVELYEIYENQTAQEQEVIYYFSLPETAVLTGVWLGASEDRDDRFVYQVAPRGAAQETYREQVRRNIDPALLEQLGPSQYRLRIFPVLPVRQNWDNRGLAPTIEDAPPMHMWLTYEVMAEDNRWPMPHLAKGFNVYRDRSTERLLNSEVYQLDAEMWLPESVEAVTAVAPVSHRYDFNNGSTLLASPINSELNIDSAESLNIAIVLDRSRSMAAYGEQIQNLFKTVQSLNLTGDVILTASEVRSESPSIVPLENFDASNIVYFGGQNAQQLLIQFDDLAGEEAYDAVFVMTDGTGYRAGETDVAVPAPDMPVWMVHVNGRFPLGYDDNTLDVILASGGGTVGSIEEGLTRYMQFRRSQENGVWSDIIDGYVWTLVETDSLDVQLSHDSAFSAIAARRFIQTEQIANRGTITELDTLDALHAIAVEEGIVTPYSSMIVLVNLAQQRMLDELSEADDRFDREFEEIGDTQQPPVTVTGVPEPEEWLLIILGVGMLIYFMRKNRLVQAGRMAI